MGLRVGADDATGGLLMELGVGIAVCGVDVGVTNGEGNCELEGTDGAEVETVEVGEEFGEGFREAVGVSVPAVVCGTVGVAPVGVDVSVGNPEEVGEDVTEGIDVDGFWVCV
jgi:hypothetical protein